MANAAATGNVGDDTLDLINQQSSPSSREISEWGDGEVSRMKSSQFFTLIKTRRNQKNLPFTELALH